MSGFNKSTKSQVRDVLKEQNIERFADVSTTDPENGQILKWVAATSLWTPAADVSGSTAGHTIQNAGSNLTDRTYLNFTGSGVSVTDDSGNNTTKVTITAGSGSGQTNTASNEGSGTGLVMTKNNLNLPFFSALLAYVAIISSAS